MGKIKLYYFDIYGRAEPSRMLLSHAKADWENVPVTGEDLKKMKEDGTAEFGALPVLEIDGKHYA